MGRIDVNVVSELLDEEIIELPWFNYDLGGRFGGKLNKNADTFAKTHGIIAPGINKNTQLPKVINQLLESNFDGIAGFYVGILAFFTKKVLKNLIFTDEKNYNTLNDVIIKQKCHPRYKENLQKIANMEFNFEDFLFYASKNEKLFFDYNSAIAVYKLQGKDAIFGILSQIFWTNRYNTQFSVKLIDKLPVKLQIEISDWLSGCSFPVVVSPYNDTLAWKKMQNGWFLYQKYNEKWLTLDCAGTNFITLGHYPLGNRLNFLSHGGQPVPYLICYNWGEIIDAVSIFRCNLLIRDLKNDLFNNYWFIFGPNSKLNVKYIKNGIWNTFKDWGIPIHYDEVSNHRNGLGITVDLNKNFISYCKESDIAFNASEAYDWFEIGEKCKTLWK